MATLTFALTVTSSVFQCGRCGDCLPIPSLARDHGLWYRVIRPMHWSWSNDLGQVYCISVDLMILSLTLIPASRPLSELYGRMVSILTSVLLFAIFYTPVAVAQIVQPVINSPSCKVSLDRQVRQRLPVQVLLWRKPESELQAAGSFGILHRLEALLLVVAARHPRLFRRGSPTFWYSASSLVSISSLTFRLWPIPRNNNRAGSVLRRPAF